MTNRNSADAAAGGRRRTPLDPYPEPRPSESGGEDGSRPTELGADAISILDGRTFMFSDALGDVPAGSTGGLVHEDTRFLSLWELSLGRSRLTLLKCSTVDYNTASFFLANPELPDLPANSLAVRRMRLVDAGALEHLAVFNTAPAPIPVELSLACGADFADLFEVRHSVRDRSANIACHSRERSLRFRYRVPGFVAETTIQVERSEVVEAATGQVLGSAPPRVEGSDLVWEVELPARCALMALVRVGVRVNEVSFAPDATSFEAPRAAGDASATAWLERIPAFESGSDLLNRVFGQSVVDLAALRISGDLLGERYVLPAAGLPWFMTLFGRDTLITSLQTLWVGASLTRGALHLLGALQGMQMDDFRDEEPGKIMHEVRSGELTLLGEKPHSPYYGTSDATPLWLILLSEYWRFTGEDAFVRARWHNVLAALAWIDRYGDRDGDGYVEYATRSSEGLGNQCWKDSWDGVQFADGTIPHLPIATAEIQGYVYDAKLRIAELARRLALGDELAERLEKEAALLRARFNQDFWSEERGGFYVIGLDGDKRPIDSLTSNIGHLLWSGIVPEERARLVADHLLSDRLFSGWGVRTLSSDDRGYNPIGYHVGTIWPHDNSIVALGLARSGFRDAANRIAVAQLEAASFTGYRLPEAFAGFERSISRFPVPYPTACSPQAWATGAPFVFIQAMLGLEARDGELHLDPAVPAEIGRITIRGLHALGHEWDVEATARTGEIKRGS